MSEAIPQLQRVRDQHYRIVGDVRFSNVVALRAQGSSLMEAASESAQFIDLAQLTYRDSAVLLLCLAWLREARRKGRSLLLQNPPDLLREMAQLSGVDVLLFGAGAGS